MDFSKTFEQAKNVALLQEKAMKSLATKSKQLPSVAVIVLLAALAASLGSYFFPTTIGDVVLYRPDPMGVIVQTVLSFVTSFAGLYIMGALAQAFSSKKIKTEQFVNVVGHGMVVSFLGIFPPLSIISGLWILAILWKTCSKVGGMKLGTFIGFAIVSGIAIFIVAGLIGLLGVGAEFTTVF
jgi:hypothetical protein